MSRPSASARGYNARWHKARKTYLLHHPHCVMCSQHGIHTQAAVVDHIKPHRGDQILFWDKANWQSLCTRHHNSTKKTEENKGYNGAIGVDGWPTDKRHPFNANERKRNQAGGGKKVLPVSV